MILTPLRVGAGPLLLLPAFSWWNSTLRDSFFIVSFSDASSAGIFFGFAAALLGVSGFESSSNYIEEQQPGVFPKTLRNMWAITAVLNPSLSVLSFFLLRLDEISANYGPAARARSLPLAPLTSLGPQIACSLSWARAPPAAG